MPWNHELIVVSSIDFRKFASMIYQFENFTVDTREYLFIKGTEKTSLEPRVFDVLVYLIENKDRVVSKDELIEKLWDGRVISDSALNTCIRSIRRALGDDGEKQRYIRTHPKRGFQFVGRISELVSTKPDNFSNHDPRKNFRKPLISSVVFSILSSLSSLSILSKP